MAAARGLLLLRRFSAYPRPGQHLPGFFKLCFGGRKGLGLLRYGWGEGAWFRGGGVDLVVVKERQRRWGGL